MSTTAALLIVVQGQHPPGCGISEDRIYRWNACLTQTNMYDGLEVSCSDGVARKSGR